MSEFDDASSVLTPPVLVFAGLTIAFVVAAHAHVAVGDRSMFATLAASLVLACLATLLALRLRAHQAAVMACGALWTVTFIFLLGGLLYVALARTWGNRGSQAFNGLYVLHALLSVIVLVMAGRRRREASGTFFAGMGLSLLGMVVVGAIVSTVFART